MALSGRFGWLLLGALAAGCSNQVEQEPTRGLDTQMGNRTPGGTTGGSSGGSGVTDACTTAASWQAHDLKFDASESPRDFAEALNPLLKAQTSPAIAVSNHMEPHCVWMVAFSATDETSGAAEHAATYTEMFRHPAGLWTAAPQTTGWIRVVDAAAQAVWIPIANVTGSATFGATDCSSLSKAETSAMIPRSAGTLPITTAEGATTLGALLGRKTSNDGWQVRFSFAANVTP
jgi:hypothetical protein